MIVTQQVLDSLKQIGLNLYERRLWVALLSRGTSTAGELSSLAKVPHSRTYDVLESLAEKGFVMIQNAKPLKYVSITPSEALERAKKKLVEDTSIATERISALQSSSTVKELDKMHKEGVQLVEPGELIGSLKGSHAMHQQLDTIFKGARKKISIVTTAEGLAVLHSKHGELLKKAAGKGVKIRIAAPVGKDNGSLPSVKSYAEVRKLDKNAGRFCLVDDNHLVMSLTDEKNTHPTQDLSLWTQSDHVAGAVLGPMFDSVWSRLSTA